MHGFLTIVSVVSFICLLLLNLAFRVRLFKAYKALVQNKIQFGMKHILNKRLLEHEVLGHYPQHRELILRFVNGIRFSVVVATILILILAFSFGYILFFHS